MVESDEFDPVLAIGSLRRSKLRTLSDQWPTYAGAGSQRESIFGQWVGESGNHVMCKTNIWAIMIGSRKLVFAITVTP